MFDKKGLMDMNMIPIQKLGQFIGRKVYRMIEPLWLYRMGIQDNASFLLQIFQQLLLPGILTITYAVNLYS